MAMIIPTRFQPLEMQRQKLIRQINHLVQHNLDSLSGQTNKKLLYWLMVSQFNNLSQCCTHKKVLVLWHIYSSRQKPQMFFCPSCKGCHCHGCDDSSILIKTPPWLNVTFQSLKFSEPCLVFLFVTASETRQFEVIKSFFPRLIDRCRGQRKALSYKPVGQFGLTLIGAWFLPAGVIDCFAWILNLLTFSFTLHFLEQGWKHSDSAWLLDARWVEGGAVS